MNSTDQPKSCNGALRFAKDSMGLLITLTISITTVCGAWWGLQLRMERVITAQRRELSIDLTTAKAELIAGQTSLEKAMLSQDARWVDRLAGLSRDFDDRIATAIRAVKSDLINSDRAQIKSLTVEIEKLRAALRPQPP